MNDQERYALAKKYKEQAKGPEENFYWAGYMKGTERKMYGDGFGTGDDHQKYLSLADDTDPSMKAIGRGYLDGLNGILL